MRRFLLVSLAILFSTLSAGLFAPYSAKAQQSPSLNFQITDNLLLEYPESGPYQSCGPQDVSYNWYDLAFNNESIDPSVKTSFDNARNNGVWAVVNYLTTDYKAVQIFWRENNDIIPQITFDTYWQSYQFNNPTTNTPINYNFLELTIQPSVQDECIYSAYYTGNNYMIQNNSTLKMFFYAGEYTVAPGLEDYVSDIPESYNPPTTQRPNISYTVDDKKVSLFSRKQSNLPIPNYKIKWLITNLTTDGVQPDPIFTQDGYSYPDQKLDFTVPSYGTYMIYAQYANDDGSIISKYNGENLGQSSIYLIVNGTIHSANTDDYECDEDGHCTYVPPPLYEDCSDYDASNVFGWSGCYIRNFQVWLIQTIKWLFVPDSQQLSTSFQNFTDKLSTSLGFLWTPFDLIINVYQTAVNSSVTNNDCSLPPLTMFGSTATVKLCAWRYQFPELFDIMRIIIQGGIAISFIWVCWRLLMRIFGYDPGDDDDADSETQEVRWRDDRTGETGDWERKRK